MRLLSFMGKRGGGEMGKLTARGRKQIKTKNFALAGRKFPIHDRAHAKAALSMVGAHGTAEEKRKVRAAVHRKYPTLGGKKK